MIELILGAIGLVVLSATVQARAALADDETGRWTIDGWSDATTCVRCGRKLKRGGRRLVLDEDTSVIVAAGPRCAKLMAEGVDLCDHCDELDELPPIPGALGTQPDCCTTPYKEWSATGRGGITYGEAADAVYADSFARSRRGEPGLTVSHSRIVKTMGKAKRQAWKDCQRYCGVYRLDGDVFAHHRGTRVHLSTSPDTVTSSAEVVGRRGVYSTTWDGLDLYHGPDYAAAIEAGRSAIEDPFASTASTASTTSEVPF